MMARIRYVFLSVGVILGLHFALTYSQPAYGSATSISRIAHSWSSSGSLLDPSLLIPTSLEGDPLRHDSSRIKSYLAPGRRANATFVILARNSDLHGLRKSIKGMEDRFNRRYRYPYTFLNDEPFSDHFKKGIMELTDAPVEFGLIPREHWYQPEWIDEDLATKMREEMIRKQVIYGHSVPYRNMCRFQSGFFFHHPLMQKYRYYWRVEPDIQYYCDLQQDPFLFMEDNNKVYGFTLTIPDYIETIRTLWDRVKDFMKAHPEFIAKDNAMKFLSHDGGETYNRCHFWSNFEIADADFWRAPAYTAFFQSLDRAGGFYYERWGDAPVHSIGAALLAPKNQLHFFNDIGYRHEPFEHCPTGDAHARGACWCAPEDSLDYEQFSCLSKYEAMMGSQNIS